MLRVLSRAGSLPMPSKTTLRFTLPGGNGTIVTAAGHVADRATRGTAAK